jgi:flagellar hook-associated protein 1 FlgK
MSDMGLYIASTGLMADRTAMDTVAQNVANANTPGYLRETPEMTALPGGTASSAGGGVEVSGITQASDAMVQANALGAASQASYAAAGQQSLQGIQSVFTEPSTYGLSEQLSSFWSSWDSIGTDPLGLGSRTVVVSSAQSLATTLNQQASQLATQATETGTQLTSLIKQVNTQFAEVATLNEQIVSSSAAGQQVAALVDQRNQLVNQLGTEIGVTARPQSDGTVNLYVGGLTAVQGTVADSLGVSTSGGVTSVVSTATGTAGAVSGGTAAALLATLNQYIPDYVSQINGVANDLATTVNNQLAAGYTASGASGSGYPMFTSSTGGAVTAASIEVSSALVSNPMDIAASSSATYTNNGANAQAMAELYDTPTGPDQAYRSLVAGIGTQTATANDQAQSTAALSQSANSLQQSISGVNTDQELTNMLNYQQAYQASAKVIATVSSMMQSLLQAV